MDTPSWRLVWLLHWSECVLTSLRRVVPIRRFYTRSVGQVSLPRRWLAASVTGRSPDCSSVPAKAAVEQGTFF